MRDQSIPSASAVDNGFSAEPVLEEKFAAYSEIAGKFARTDWSMMMEDVGKSKS